MCVWRRPSGAAPSRNSSRQPMRRSLRFSLRTAFSAIGKVVCVRLVNLASSVLSPPMAAMTSCATGATRRAVSVIFSLNTYTHSSRQRTGQRGTRFKCSPSSSSPQCSAVQYPSAHTHQSQSPGEVQPQHLAHAQGLCPKGGEGNQVRRLSKGLERGRSRDLR